MTELLAVNSAEGVTGLPVLLLIGAAVFGGAVGGKLFQRLHIPQIIGYVVIGMVLGPLLKIISPRDVQFLEPFNLFALGVIGFLVGGELKRDIFVRFGKQVPVILLFEGVLAFLLVGVLTFLVMWHFSDWQVALAVSVVFGAICSATDPASTIAVLWEYKCRGPVTSMVTAIVTLDDALALTLYAISVGVAGVLTGHQELGIGMSLLHTLYELGGSLVLGVAFAAALTFILNVIEDDREKTLVFTLGTLLLCIGAAIYLHLDVILSCMAAGVVMINVKSRRAAASFEALHKYAAAPIYVLFFVLVGARLSFSHFNTMIGFLVAAYVFGSIVGKTCGAYLGGLYSGAVRNVRNYLGLCLYPQGGIAIGLLIIASSRFESNISAIMLLVVIIGAFILQIIGPEGVKIGAKKAGEIGLNITEQDLISKYKVSDVMETDVPVINGGTSLNELLKTVSSTEHLYYCVVDTDKKVTGAITLDGVRNTFATQEINDWLVALDIAEPVVDVVTPDTSLPEAIELMGRDRIEHMPVVASKQDKEYAGVLDLRAMRRQLSAEVLSRQREADSMYGRRPEVA